MAEITSGALFSWRDYSSNLNAAITLTNVANYVRSGHTCLGSPTVTVDTAFPLSNMLDRRLAKYARLICTPAQDVGSGGNNRWYYANFQIRVAITTTGLAGQAFAMNTIGLIGMDCRYPSIEPNVEVNGYAPGGYYGGIGYDVFSASNWTGNNPLHKTVGDGTTYDQPRMWPSINGYTWPNWGVRCYTRGLTASAIFYFGPGNASSYVGESANPGTCYITIGRLWLADSVIIPAGVDAGWKLRPIDSSIVRRSRGQQVYADEYPRLRSLDFAVSAQTDSIQGTNAQGVYSPSWAIGGQNSEPPGFAAMGLEAGTKGEVLVMPRLSWNKTPYEPWFGYAGAMYGTVSPPGISIDDQSSGAFSRITGTIIESR